MDVTNRLWLARKWFAISVLMLSVAILTRLPPSGALLREETRYAEISQEMLTTGDWIVPRLNGVAYLEKPPLLGWLGAAMLACFPENRDFGLRLVPALTSLAACAALMALARRMGGARLAFATGLTFLVMPFSWVFSQTFATDGPFADALTVALCCIGIGRLRGGMHWVNFVLCSAALTFASLVRSPLLTATLFAPAAFVLGYRGGVVKSCIRVVAPLTAGLLAASPWFFAIQAREPGFFEEFFVNHHIGRAGAREEEKAFHREPVYFYLPLLAGGLGLFTLPGLYAALRGVGSRARPVVGRYLATAAWIFLAFTLLSGKRATYILPVFPWLALTLAWTQLESANDLGVAKILSWCWIPAAVLTAALGGVYFGILRIEPPLLPWLDIVLFLAGLTVASFVSVFGFRRQRSLLATCAAALGLAGSYFVIRQGLSAIEPAGNHTLHVGGRTVELRLDVLGTSDLCQYIQSQSSPEDLVANHGRYRHGLSYYMKRRTHVFAPPGELAVGIDAAKESPDVLERFRAEKDLVKVWNGARRIWVLGELDDFVKIVPRQAEMSIPTVLRADRPPYAGMDLHVRRRIGRYGVFTNRP